MAVSRETVVRIAELARIRVSKEELAEVNRRLNEILGISSELGTNP